MRRRALLAGLLPLAGCGLSERAYVERRDWPLVASRTVKLPFDPGGRVLLVRTVRTGPGLEGRSLRSLQPDGSVQVAFYDEWVAPPAEAVEASLRGWLADSGLFSAVTQTGSRLRASLVLEADLTALIADPPRGQARVTLSYALLDETGLATRVLSQRALTGSAPLTSTEPGEQARAMNAALASLLGDVETTLAAARPVHAAFSRSR